MAYEPKPTCLSSRSPEQNHKPASQTVLETYQAVLVAICRSIPCSPGSLILGAHQTLTSDVALYATQGFPSLMNFPLCALTWSFKCCFAAPDGTIKCELLQPGMFVGLTCAICSIPRQALSQMILEGHNLAGSIAQSACIIRQAADKVILNAGKSCQIACLAIKSLKQMTCGTQDDDLKRSLACQLSSSTHVSFVESNFGVINQPDDCMGTHTVINIYVHQVIQFMYAYCTSQEHDKLSAVHSI